MLRALYSGISGMKVNQTKMDVIGNNIANVGTTSFKGGTVRFQDMLSQNVSEALAPGRLEGGTNPRQVGLGVQLGGINTDMSQGMMQPTGRNLDVAMDGSGYLMVDKGDKMFDNAKSLVVDNTATSATNHVVTNAQGTQTMYTRDGSLTLDSEGNLLTSDGYRVLGYSVTDGLNESVQQVDDPTNPAGTIHFVDSNSKTLKTVGNGTAAMTTAVKAAATADAAKTTADAAKVAADAAAAANPADPVLAAAATAADAAAVTADAAAVTADATATAAVNATDSTKYLKTLRIPDEVYDDKSNQMIRVKTFNIEKDGSIKGVLEDGRVTVLGQIAVAAFKNPEALSNLGKNLYQSSANSGVPVVKTGLGEGTNDNSKGYGDMNQGMLEMSNVDLAAQFTDMIVTSRAFQANSKTITTGDEILQDILNLKR